MMNITSLRSNGQALHLHSEKIRDPQHVGISLSSRGGYKRIVIDLLQRVFLPKGYPDSVTPDYAKYQIYNALQAFCNSLASLLASRALLEGYGIGDPTATTTNALLLTIALDVCSRMTTILSAHWLGTSLGPSSKRYRLLADILNDIALILDTISPAFSTLSLSSLFPGIAGLLHATRLGPMDLGYLRYVALGLSASCRALCGVVAGGSKAAISLHFASPLEGTGDIGDLNAKDASKETVLALFGMLVGSLIVPRLTSPLATYTTLAILVIAHIILNYLAVTSLVLRSLNPERLWISWFLYDEFLHPTSPPSSALEVELSQALSPQRINGLEPLFPFARQTYSRPLLSSVPVLKKLELRLPVVSVNWKLKSETFTTYRDPRTNQILGYVTLGSSLAKNLKRPLGPDVIAEFQLLPWFMWLDEECLEYDEDESTSGSTIATGRGRGRATAGEGEEGVVARGFMRRDVLPHVHVFFKEDSTQGLRVQAWLAAGLICKAITSAYKAVPTSGSSSSETQASANASDSAEDVRDGQIKDGDGDDENEDDDDGEDDYDNDDDDDWSGSNNSARQVQPTLVEAIRADPTSLIPAPAVVFLSDNNRVCRGRLAAPDVLSESAKALVELRRGGAADRYGSGERDKKKPSWKGWKEEMMRCGWEFGDGEHVRFREMLLNQQRGGGRYAYGYGDEYDEEDEYYGEDSDDESGSDEEGGSKEEGKGKKAEKDWGAECGVWIPEPENVVVGLGYSYEGKKDQ